LLFFIKKDGRKLPSPTLPINARVMPILTSALSVYIIFAITKTKW